MKYKILFDSGTEEFNSVGDAVKHAFSLGYKTNFLIVNVVDWEAVQKCPYADCPKVKYKDCPIHGLKNTNP
jgi:hypothetical protein